MGWHNRVFQAMPIWMARLVGNGVLRALCVSFFHMDQRFSQNIWQEGHRQAGDDLTIDPAAGSSSLKLTFDDVCYVFFRHKWKILTFAVLGIAAALILYYLSPRLYRSEAKLMVKYITEVEPQRPGSPDGEGARSPVLRGETVVNSELEILTSMDLAMKVAEAVGPERILARVGGGKDLVHAALVIHSGTLPDVPRRGNVIRVVFEHPDPTVVRPVLSNLVDRSFIKHSEIHRALASLDDFAVQRKQTQERLHNTEQSLWDLKKTNAVFSVEESKRAAAEQVARTHQTLNDLETELEARQAAWKAIQSAALAHPAETNAVGHDERREIYQSVLNQLDQLRRRKTELLGQFLEGSSMVQPVQQEITQLEKQRRDMEREDPTLLYSNLSPAAGGRAADGLDEAARITILQSRVAALRTSLQRARAEEARLYELEAPIVRLQRTKELEESKFRYLSSALEEAQIDSGLGSGCQISAGCRTRRRRCVSLGPSTSGWGAGRWRSGVRLGVGFAHGVFCGSDGETADRVPPFDAAASVYVHTSAPPERKAAGLLRDRTGETEPSSLPAPVGAGPQDLAGSQLQPYVEAIRDRILNRFENLARKPKLVGVCGASSGAGVTSIAAGLAASLSEAGDLKVLLVDMKRGQGRAHPMLGSRKSCSLLDALEGPNRQEALIAPNLYLASANGSGKQEVVSSPRKFTTVVPHLNTSDYDYIVFDLPPVNPVSITPRLAKHMDIVLMIVEAEKARRNTVRGAGSLLLEFTKNVAVVLNKTRSYGPKQLSQAA